VLEHDAQRDAILLTGFDELIGGFEGGRHRFLDEDVLAGLRRLLRDLGVQVVRRADAHGVDVGVFDQLAIVGVRLPDGELLGEVPDSGGGHVGDGDEVRAVDLIERDRVRRGDDAAADDAES